MVTSLDRGQVWWCETEIHGRRPYLILSRSAAIPVMHSVLAAPLTSRMRGLPSELLLDRDDGVLMECVVNFDNMMALPKSSLIERICVLDPIRQLQACTALEAAVECSEP